MKVNWFKHIRFKNVMRNQSNGFMSDLLNLFIAYHEKSLCGLVARGNAGEDMCQVDVDIATNRAEFMVNELIAKHRQDRVVLEMEISDLKEQLAEPHSFESTRGKVQDEINWLKKLFRKEYHGQATKQD